MKSLNFFNGGPDIGTELNSCPRVQTESTNETCQLRDIYQSSSELLPSDKEFILLPDKTAMMNPLFTGTPIH